MASLSLLCVALLGVLLCALSSLFITNVSADLLPVTTDQLHDHLKSGFHEGRSFLQPAQKDKARQYIKDFFQDLADDYSTSVIEQSYIYNNPNAKCGGSTCPLYPDLYAEFEAGGFRGNALNFIQRSDEAALGNGLALVWSTLSGPKYKQTRLQLPTIASGYRGNWPLAALAGFSEFLRSDHSSFWTENAAEGGSLKAVFITDTAYFRGIMRECYHQPCDNLGQVTPEKLEFLAKATEMLVRYYLQESTERTAVECGGNPQENWDPVETSGTSFLDVGWLLMATMVALGNQVCEN